MIEKYLKQTSFASQEDFMANFKVEVPENFNFAYDVVDGWAQTHPDKKALCWTNDKGEHIDFTFADIKRESDKAASWFQSLGIGRGDMVMLILKRRYEFWFSIIALHKIGAVCIPATHLLTEKDIIFRCNAADIKMVVTVGDKVVTSHVDNAIAECPTLRHRVTLGDQTPEGWLNYNAGVSAAKPFIAPLNPNCNSDISLLYFTSGTTGNPKMVAHDFTYPLAHIITASYWHNLTAESLHLTA
ncbi:MAG: AMP-binding protein, partial [Rikenellaceae bacterium]